MTARLLILGLAFAAAACAPEAADPQAAPPSQAFLPLAPGNTWTYADSADPGSAALVWHVVGVTQIGPRRLYVTTYRYPLRSGRTDTMIVSYSADTLYRHDRPLQPYPFIDFTRPGGETYQLTVLTAAGDSVLFEYYIVRNTGDTATVYRTQVGEMYTGETLTFVRGVGMTEFRGADFSYRLTSSTLHSAH